MASQQRKVEFFGLSTCGWCKKTREWLDENQVAYDLTYLDLVHGDDRDRAKERVLQFVSKLAVPVIIIDDGSEVIQGFKPDRLEECLK